MQIIKMKLMSLVFISCFTVFSFISTKTGLPGFPEYSVSMKTSEGDGCSAKCWFNSCSGTANCVCSCSVFKCECEELIRAPEEIKNAISISMTKRQYKNTKELAFYFRNMNTSEGNDLYENIAFMIQAMKDNNASKFYNYRDSVLNSLENLNKANRIAVNEFLNKKGANISI